MVEYRVSMRACIKRPAIPLSLRACIKTSDRAIPLSLRACIKTSDTGISTVMPWREEEDRLPPELGPCPTVVLELGGEEKSWTLKSETLTASMPKKKYVCVHSYVRQVNMKVDGQIE